MPDRKASITLTFSFDVVIDEDSLRRRIPDFDPSLREPTASELNEAFESWKAERVTEARKNFKTGNSLSDNKDIKIQVT